MSSSLAETARGDLFTRSGHLTLLTLDRFETGDLSTHQFEEVGTHLATCSTCSEAWGAARSVAFPLPPPNTRSTGRRAAMRWASAGIGSVVAVAAALALAIWLQPERAQRSPHDDAHLSAGAYTTSSLSERTGVTSNPLDDRVLDLRVEMNDASIETGDRIPWDEPLSFELHTASPGFVAVLVTEGERDLEDLEAGDTESSPHWATLAPVVEIGPSTPWTHLHQARPRPTTHSISERFSIVFCESIFTLDELEGLWPELPDPTGCVLETIDILRFGNVADSYS